jgi:capsular exopolysaccharide synthesis family protein
MLLEVLNVSEDPSRGSFSAVNFEANDVSIMTQVNILRSGTFLRRGAERMQSETVPVAPTGVDLFSRLRQRIRPASQDPVENTRLGLNSAIETFDARPINKTRLIELTCESTSPDVAAQFLNSMAAEFVEDTSRSRMQTAQKTSEWLSAQIEETKSKVQDAEERLREFVRSSGNVFAGSEAATLDDTKLAQLKGELARIQADRIVKQTRYELTLKNSPETLGEILDDSELRTYQQQISALKKDRAALETVYTPKHEKVQRVNAQIELLERTYHNQISSVVSRIKNDYQAAQRQEKLLNSAYAGQSQRVGSEAGKAAEYNALKREVDTLRQMYQSLLLQGNQAGMSSSVPVNPIRIVEASAPPATPYRPRPVLNISFGIIFGLAVTVAFAYVRERMDRSVRPTGTARRILNTPELGVIPTLQLNGRSTRWKRLPARAKNNVIDVAADKTPASLAAWQVDTGFIADSFRSTLASMLRHQPSGVTHRMIMVTSPGPAEGKTTVVQNLGIALAETGRKVLLVDADFRRPHLHHRFDLPNDLSLIDALSDSRPLADCSPNRIGIKTAIPGLWIVPNRPTREHVAKALYSPRLRTIFAALREEYDIVLVDVPPILHLADARIVAPLTDAVILVLRSGVTHRENAGQAFQRIQEDGLYLLGTVLTDVNLNSQKHRYYYDYADDDRT